MTKRKLTEEQVRIAVAGNTCINHILSSLNMAITGGNYRTISKWIKKLNLDTSHFIDQRYLFVPPSKSSNEEIFVEKENYNYCRSRLKLRIINENLILYKCEQCGITEWNGKPLSLHLDHINGNRNDNRLENLRFLCPNCHSLTDNYCGKANRLPSNFCIDCGSEISRNCKRCGKCAKLALKSGVTRRRTKIEWPSIEELMRMISETSRVSVAKQLGISETAVRKHLKHYLVPQPGIEPGIRR